MLINNREPVKTNHQSSLSDGKIAILSRQKLLERHWGRNLHSHTCSVTRQFCLLQHICYVAQIASDPHGKAALELIPLQFTQRDESAAAAHRSNRPTKHNHIHGCSRVPMMVFSTRLSTFGCNLNRARRSPRGPAGNRRRLIKILRMHFASCDG